MHTEATDRLIAVAQSPSSTDEGMNAAANSFFAAMSGATVEDANAAIRKLSNYFDPAETPRAGLLALICGALVERGCDPLTIAEPLTKRIAGFLKLSAELVDACHAIVAKQPGEKENPHDAFEKAREQVAVALPQQNAAWEALKQFWQPAIAVFTSSAETRRSNRQLRELATKISDYHEGGHWISLMLSVLDDEPIVVIEPQTGLGILGKISGVVDNFQLNMLLMDCFPKSGLLARSRIAKRVANVARGVGPQQTDDIVTGVWNLYTWEAIEANSTLPNPDDYGSFWIWNEGSPEDIPTFEGRRAILLGKASYSRSWRSQRMFGNLPAKLEIEHKLKKDEVDQWLQRMFAAKNASR